MRGYTSLPLLLAHASLRAAALSLLLAARASLALQPLTGRVAIVR